MICDMLGLRAKLRRKRKKTSNSCPLMHLECGSGREVEGVDHPTPFEYNREKKTIVGGKPCSQNKTTPDKKPEPVRLITVFAPR